MVSIGFSLKAKIKIHQFNDNKEKKGADVDFWVTKLQREDLPRALVAWEHYIRESSTIEGIFEKFDEDEVHTFVYS